MRLSTSFSCSVPRVSIVIFTATSSKASIGSVLKWKTSKIFAPIPPISVSNFAKEPGLSLIRIRIKDKPGSLAQLLTEIGGIGANILDVFHLRTDPMLALDEVAVNITMETRGTEHEKDVLNRIKALGHDAQVQ